LPALKGDTVLVNVQGLGPTGLPFAAIQSAKLVMTDRLIKATAPLSVEGADEIEPIEETEEKEED
jgi:ribosome maturation factor RimP